MSKIISKAEAIGAQFALIVPDNKHHIGYTKFYKKGSYEISRNCLLFWDERQCRWCNSSELSFSNIEYGLRITDRKYSLINFTNRTRSNG